MGYGHIITQVSSVCELLMPLPLSVILQDAANEYSLKEFYEKREEVEKGLHAGVRERLGGVCCPVNRQGIFTYTHEIAVVYQ